MYTTTSSAWVVTENVARVSAHGPVSVMYPMVVDLEMFLELKKRFLEAAADIPCEGIRHGAMFEVPSACLQAREVMDAADFGSIGSNDLIQYLFAVDRNNEMVAHDYHPERPVLWSLMQQVADAAGAAGKELSICGELASDPLQVARLADLGIRNLSVSPRLIPAVRRAAAEHFAGGAG